MASQKQQSDFNSRFILKNAENAPAGAEARLEALPPEGEQETAAAFAAQIFAHVGREDLQAYSAAEREQAALMAARALSRWQAGETVIEAETGSLTRGGAPVDVLNLVNTNKPFLLDSVLAEIYGNAERGLDGEAGLDSAPPVYLVAHPVFAAARRENGDLALAMPSENAAANADKTPNSADAENARAVCRVSLIQIHLKFADAAQAAALTAALRRVAEQVRIVFHDRAAMQLALRQVRQAYQRFLPAPYQPQREQAIEFLDWLEKGNFIFLGAREYAYRQGAGGAAPRLAPQGAELGILTDADIRILRSPEAAAAEKTGESEPEIFAFMQGADLMLVSKARTRSLVHRNAFLDYIGLKLFDEAGNLRGELRLVGLFTANVYHNSVLHIPYLRPKAQQVIARLGYSRADHSGRALLNILETYPREDMFRLPASVLADNAERILELSERPRLRILANADIFGNFISVLVFVPRDRYNTAARIGIGAALLRAYAGDFYECTPRFFDESLTRIHYILHRRSGAMPPVAPAALEAEIDNIIGIWEDKVAAAAAQKPQYSAAIIRLAKALPQAYRDIFRPAQALGDARALAALSAENPLYAEFYAEDSAAEGGAAAESREQRQDGHLFLKLLHRGGALELSSRVPILENMGFRVIAEQTVEIPAAEPSAAGSQADSAEAAPSYLHFMELAAQTGAPIAYNAALRRDLAILFKDIWAGNKANDGFNALAAAADFSLAAMPVMRAYGRYLQQAGSPYSQGRLAAALCRYPALARLLYQLFCLRFDPKLQSDKAPAQKAELEAELEAGLRNVPALDDDRIIRAFHNLIAASLRANAFPPEAEAEPPENLAFKFDPQKIDNLPRPRPYREIFVYGPLVEGVHLRFGPIARGGIRWSDRGQDYRTEILGLVKAQQVKNAVIVPVGAKGGFYPHYLPQTGDRAAQSAAAQRAYSAYIAAMLSITDNIEAGRIIPAPAASVRHDGDDPYFVVAADKGTASFSDTANKIAQEAGFWLDDAFASGGSQGYDHKEMGITAKGAWEAVKRHFREMNHNIQEEEFTCAGVGDMSGDVFGNAMLLSAKTKLIAAFDHRDIFIDPAPDCALSYAERARLFALPRSSWQDYDRGKISAGGGVFSRSAKNIELSPEAAKAIGFAGTSGASEEIIAAILRAPVDLLWFGGIGTYIRGAQESNAQVGDRANDALRIEGGELRAKVAGEGANLAMTQSGRVEYALKGGRLNTDAIDNSAGVNCSDIEVNLKIAFASAMGRGSLTRARRNALLESMSAEVSALILRNNYLQTLALSLGQRKALPYLPHQINLMNGLEKHGLLDRRVEALPDNRILAERQAKGLGLTRPEAAVLMAYAKNSLEAELTESDLVGEPYFEEILFAYFPQAMREEFADEIRSHPLRRAIIATQLANEIINRGGSSFVSRLADKFGRPAADILRAFIIIYDGFALSGLYAEIDALDNALDGNIQNEFYGAVSKMLFDATGWILRNLPEADNLRSQVALIKNAYPIAAGELPEFLPVYLRENQEKSAKTYEEKGVPPVLAAKLAMLELADIIPDIVLIARRTHTQLSRAAADYFALAEIFAQAQLNNAVSKMPIADYYDGLAAERAQNIINESLRAILIFALEHYGHEAEPLRSWQNAQAAAVEDALARLQILRTGNMNLARLSLAAGILADLAAQCR